MSRAHSHAEVIITPTSCITAAQFFLPGAFGRIGRPSLHAAPPLMQRANKDSHTHNIIAIFTMDDYLPATLLPTLPPRRVPLRPHREAHHVIHVDASFHNSVPTARSRSLHTYQQQLTNSPPPCTHQPPSSQPHSPRKLLSPDSTVLINQMELLATLVAVRIFLPLMCARWHTGGNRPYVVSSSRITPTSSLHATYFTATRRSRRSQHSPTTTYVLHARMGTFNSYVISPTRAITTRLHHTSASRRIKSAITTRLYLSSASRRIKIGGRLPKEHRHAVVGVRSHTHIRDGPGVVSVACPRGASDSAHPGPNFVPSRAASRSYGVALPGLPPTRPKQRQPPYGKPRPRVYRHRDPRTQLVALLPDMVYR